MAIDHTGIEISTASHAETVKAYQAALAPLGYKVKLSFGGENQDMPEAPGVIGTGLGECAPDFWIISLPTIVTAHPTHFAFSASTRKVVREVYEAAMKAGFTSNGEPGVRAQYHASYYGAFFKDQHQNRVEVVCHTPAYIDAVKTAIPGSPGIMASVSAVVAAVGYYFIYC